MIAASSGMKKHPDFGEWIVSLKKGGPAHTLLLDGEIACCAGITLMGWRRGEAWLIFAPLAFSHMKTVYANIKKHLVRIAREKGIRRLQATVKMGDDPAARFVRHLGFDCETPLAMRAYGPNGEDMFLFARVIQ